MNIYSIRKNFKAEIKTKDKIVNAKVVFKTKEAEWLSTDKPVIIPISIHSAFHNEYQGEIKTNALISTIKNHVQGKITVFMAEKAHLHVLSLKYHNNYEKAWEECMQSSGELINRYKTYFTNCQVLRWSYIAEDHNYESAKSFLRSLSETDPLFQKCLLNDAEATYSENRVQEFPNKAIYMEKAIEDILEQCVAQFVMAKKGYRFLFYPGKPFTAQEYAALIFPQDSQIAWIPVFLSIEKKAIQAL